MTFAVAGKNSFARENALVFVGAFAAFFVPFLGLNQFATGTAVNALIAFAIVKRGWLAAAPFVLLPSLGALAYGVLFGSFTPFLAFFIPAIWAGNAAYAWVIKAFSGAKGVALGALAKTALLSACFALAYLAGLAPLALAGAFTWMQFATALTGGGVALAAQRLNDYNAVQRK
ncbi:MAG: hypothetical protein WC607_02080 [Candidatus Micrarchaeia archaeon]